MFIRNWKKEIFSAPNLLSLIRLFMIPIYISIYVNAESNRDYFYAALVLGISCLTDFLDGWIARKYNMVTNLGKILDPLADKATQLSLLLCLVTKYKILRYLLILFILKESFQLIAGGVSIIKCRKMLKGAQFTGKLCTTVLFLSLILMLLLPHIPRLFLLTLFTLDVLFMLIAFADYIFVYCRRESVFQSIVNNNNLP